MCAGCEMDIGTSEADQLRCSQARLGGDTEERVVSPPGPRRAIGGGKQRTDFRLGQEGHEPSVEALGRDGENALDKAGMIGMAKCGESEQRTDHGKPGVAGACAILPLAPSESAASGPDIQTLTVPIG